MNRSIPLSLLLLALLAAPAFGQSEWTPPDRRMPAMPTMAELDGDWMGPRAAWFDDLQVAPGAMRAIGEPRGGEVARLVRFQSGPLPVMVWSDRNGDGTADAVEIYRNGGLVVQLIDADQDGNANVLRRYDASGALISEERI